MKHFHAGYILDIVAKKISLIEKDKELLQIKGLLQHITSFDVQFPHAHDLDFNNLNPFLATLNNIITRGLPTKAPLIVERKLSKILDKTVKNPENEFEVNYIENNYSLSNNIIFELLHIIEPKFSISKNEYLGQLGSNAEWIFIDSTLKEFPFAKQIFKSQRLFSTIADGMGGERSVDFCFQSPYLYWNPNKDKIENISRIIEVDGPHHEFWQYRIYDKYRDAVAEIEGFETLRVPVTEIKQDNKLINSLFKSPIYVLFEKNYNRNLKEFIDEYILIFSPVAIARIQKTLIEYFLTNLEILKQPKINIAIIERDVPCGALSIENLDEYFTNLNALLRDGSKLELPKIELTIFPDNRFLKYTSLHLKAKIGNEIYFNKNSENYDIIIDHSILRRSCIYKENNYLTDNKIIIRSSHYSDNSFGNSRRVYCAEPLQYKPLVKKQNDGSYSPVTQIEKNINFFIENIFRKTRYWPGQLPIISRALQHLPVIGLLPTGGGKSLTFQLSVLMQPGLCVVVDPIKSLMEDQVRVLKDNWIDCCEYINSTIPSRKKRERLINYRYGEVQMLFVSPERFVMEEFREVIKNIKSFFGLAISYCVIDEVHCVSEWGHDFRSTYLFLGKNAQKYCETNNIDGEVALIGLTATASFDVLADVERELNIEHNDIANAIIMIENTIRPEMFYRVIIDNNVEKIGALQNDFNKAGENLQYWNNLELLKKSYNHHLENFNIDEQYPEGGFALNNEDEIIDLSIKSSDEFPSIIFCATKSPIATNSVMNIYTNLTSDTKGYFYGGEENDSHLEEIQKNFENFIKGKLNQIVCTKAFGMGIDKKDVRVVYHVIYSNSLESFVQEAGRAGRDKKVSESVVLFNDSSIFQIDPNLFNSDNYKQYSFLKNKWYRKDLRWNLILSNRSDKKSDIVNLIDNFNFTIEYPPPADVISEIKEFLKSKIKEKKTDRGIHYYFYDLGFKGIDVEKSQIYDMFNNQEFIIIGGIKEFIPNQTTLAEELNNAEEGTFSYVLSDLKKYKDNTQEICDVLDINTNTRNHFNWVENSLKYSNNYFDFLLRLEEYGLIDLPIANSKDRRIRFLYSRDRDSDNTGKLIYRMSCMGLLNDYTIDYKNQKLITCTLIKRKKIEDYIKFLKKYLLRYLSETTCNEKLNELELKLKEKNSLIDKILECLYFLTKFSYKEIAGKRERATDDIERMLVNSLNYTDKFEQNLFIKEEIFYYFNAKYARPDYFIGNKLFSLLKDSEGGRISTWNWVEKYTIEVLLKDAGTQQNNYKHLIGSCRKISRAMVEEELRKEWSLKLINAFALYSVNTPSYISEANDSLKKGFLNFYYSIECNERYKEFEKKFMRYFDLLQKTLEKNNSIFVNELELIKHAIMIEINLIYTSKLINNHNELLTIY